MQERDRSRLPSCCKSFSRNIEEKKIRVLRFWNSLKEVKKKRKEMGRGLFMPLRFENRLNHFPCALQKWIRTFNRCERILELPLYDFSHFGRRLLNREKAKRNGEQRLSKIAG